MLVKGQSVSKKDKESLRYQLAKLEVLIKRKAGQYCALDWKKKKIIASGEQKKKDKLNNEIVTKKQTVEAIAFLRNLNAYLEKTEKLKDLGLWLSNDFSKKTTFKIEKND